MEDFIHSQYYAPLPPVRSNREFDFSKNEYLAPMGAIFSSQKASIEIAKWFSYTVFRLFSDRYSSSE